MIDKMPMLCYDVYKLLEKQTKAKNLNNLAMYLR